MTDSTTVPLVGLSMDIEASPDTVWGILTTPERFSTWMGGDVSFEPRVGSPFRADFPNMQTVVAGEIVALDEANHRLELTWGIEMGRHADVFPAGCSLVEFRIVEAELGCRVELSHSQIPTLEVAQEYQQGGWTFHLSRLALHANRADLGAGLERTLPAWFSAWNETDEAARMEALRACCADDVEFRDDWTVATGIEALGTHIAICFMFVPGWKLEPTGDVRTCRGSALVGWRSMGPDGSMLEGFNHVIADRDGTLRRVTGFARG